LIHSDGGSNVCVCSFLFVYIAVWTHNFKPTCIFLFCIKEYSEIKTVHREFCLLYNSEYVVTVDEQMLVKWIKELTFLQQKCTCANVLLSVILIRNTPLMPSQYSYHAVAVLNINRNRMQLITSDYTHRCLCHVHWDLTAKPHDMQQLNIAGKQNYVKFSCVSVSIMASCAYKCGFMFFYIMCRKSPCVMYSFCASGMNDCFDFVLHDKCSYSWITCYVLCNLLLLW
jgi:hypothetical protein